MKALITGASSGMGKEMATILSKTYDELVLVGRDKKRLQSVKDELKDNKANIKIISMDIGDYNNCIKIYNENKNIDLLINNAGFGDYGIFDETSLEKDILMINTNVVAMHTLTKLYLKDMKEKDSGHILNVASIAGFMPGPLMSTYYATKNYVVRLSEGIREELRRDKSNVKISILCPGPVKTRFKENANITFFFTGSDSYSIAKYALDHLNRFYIVPTFPIKVSRFFMKILPSKTVAKIIYKLQTTKDNN